MTSQILPQAININYPVAGQDNDTQGFRTNYQNIQNNFIVAANEITKLQSNVTTLLLGTFTGNITSTSGNLIVSNISTPAGSGANLIIDPDGAGDVVFPVQTEIWINSTAANAITITGGTFTNGTATFGNVLQLANLSQTQVAAISPKAGMMVYNYTYGNIQAYTSHLGRWGNVVIS